MSNIILLLRAFSKEFPQDKIIIVCSNDSDLLELSSLPNVDILGLSSSPFKEWKRLLLGLTGLRKLVRQLQPDVVWSLNLGSYCRLPVPNFLALNNAHQVYPWEITKFHPGSPLRVALLRFFFRRSLRVADAVFVQTPLMGKYVRKIKGAPRSVFVVPKAVEKSDDVQAENCPESLEQNITLARVSGRRLWLYVATGMPHKNHKILFDAFLILNRKGCSDSLVLTISKIEAIALGGEAALALINSGQLILTGWIGKQHLRALYDACYGCLMPSLLESLSSAHLEAMEWKKPQIAADLPYARDLCGDAALYIDPYDGSAWAEEIKRLSEDISLQKLLVQNGSKRIATFPKSWAECARLVRNNMISVIGSRN